MEKSALQTAFEALLQENGECDAETYSKLKRVFEGGDDADTEDTDEDKGETIKLSKDAQEVFDDFKDLSEKDQKDVVNALKTESLIKEFAELSEEDQESIRDAIGESVNDLDVDTFIRVMEASIDAINECNAKNLITESSDDDFGDFDFLKD